MVKRKQIIPLPPTIISLFIFNASIVGVRVKRGNGNAEAEKRVKRGKKGKTRKRG